MPPAPAVESTAAIEGISGFGGVRCECDPMQSHGKLHYIAVRYAA
jgi:hypothetical protein